MPAPVSLIGPPKYIGLDMSLNTTGVCVLTRQDGFGEGHWLTGHRILSTETIKPTTPEGVKLTGLPRLARIYSRLETILETERPSMVAIEGYAHGASFQAHALGEVGGMARLLMFKLRIPFVEVQPTSLKVFHTGGGKASKPTIRKSILKKWRLDIPDDNQADAFGLALVSALALCPEPARMSAAEFSLVSSLRYCSPDGKPPAPLLSRPL